MSTNTAVVHTGTPGTAVAKQEHPIITLLKEPMALQMIQPMLPKGTGIKQILAEVFFAVRQNPDIAKCVPASIVQAVATCARWDLVIGETCHLVPYKVKVSKKGEPDRWEKRLVAQQDYRGKIELVKRTGAARAVTAEVVYQGDHFRPMLGTSPMIEHVPAFKSKTITHAYAVAHHGATVPPTIVVMPIADIEALRKSSKQWGPEMIRECPPWWAKKAVVHAVTKLLPKSRGAVGLEADAVDEEAELAELAEWSPVEDEADRPAAPRRVIRDEDLRRDPAALEQWTQGPDEYGLGGNGSEDELPPVDEAFDDVAQAGPGSTPNSRTPAAAPASTSERARRDEDATPGCPTCGGDMWDNRTSKRNPKAPDYKCRDRDCNGAVWLTPKGRR